MEKGPRLRCVMKQVVRKKLCIGSTNVITARHRNNIFNMHQSKSSKSFLYSGNGLFSYAFPCNKLKYNH